MTNTSQLPAMVSIGYERRAVDDLVRLLMQNRVEALVDVRLTPISRKKGFSKSSLAQTLDEVGIAYRHERRLGNPKENREPFRQGLESARARYLRHLRNGASSAYRDILELAGGACVALLCFERDHRECHRSCIADAAQADRPALEVIEL